MSDDGKILYETHEEVLRVATEARDAEIRELRGVIEDKKAEIKALELTIMRALEKNKRSRS